MKDSGIMNGGNFLDQYSDTSKMPSFFSQCLLLTFLSTDSGIVSIQECTGLLFEGHNALRRLNTGMSPTFIRRWADKLTLS